ncbi:MAG TPA: alpha/beta hydrolase [Bacillota bacterium]|nr:alpha/beta hydrolase [Bacillota bacterium]
MTKFAWKKVTYPNYRDLKLAGLLYSAKPAGTAVIVCHGFTGSKEGGGRAVAMAEAMGKMGYAGLLFDFSGCGESEGDFTDISLSNHISDIGASVDFCLNLGFSRIITVGRSFGGTAVLRHSGTDGRVAGVCVWAAPAFPSLLFSSFRNREHDPDSLLVPLTGEDGTVFVKQGFFSDLERHDVVESAALIAPRPLLIVHGDGDAVVPVKHGHAIFDAAGEPKEIAVIRNADHRFMGHHLEVWDVFFKWLKNFFPVR